MARCCPKRPKPPVENPTLTGKVFTYAQARQRWVAAGRPTRTAEEVKRIFEEVCKPCQHFVKQPMNTGRCRLCGCQLNLHRGANKIWWATESCPDDPPRWDAEVEEPAAVQEVPKVESRRERRRRRRAARQAAPEPVRPQPSTDELVIYDRTGKEAGHVLRDSWCNWHSSPAAFLVGSGPSLAGLDLSPLTERGVMSLGINNAAAWAPCRACVISDPAEKFHTAIWLDASVDKFVPKSQLDKRIRIRDRETGELVYSAISVNQCPRVWGYRKDSVWRVDDFLTADSASVGSGTGCPRFAATGNDPDQKVIFTLFPALRILHYLGVRTVYLLGVDFAMVPNAAYVFPQATNKWVPGNNLKYRLAAPMLAELRPVFERAGFMVYNTNSESRLTVFDHVPYERAVEHCRSLVRGLLRGPQDFADWYIKAGEDAE